MIWVGIGVSAPRIKSGSVDSWGVVGPYKLPVSRKKEKTDQEGEQKFFFFFFKTPTGKYVSFTG